MLRELYKLSQYVEAALPPIGYGINIVQVAIDVTPPITITPLLKRYLQGKEEKEKLGQELCVTEIGRTSDHCPILIADTGSYVLGLGKNGKIHHPMYLELLKECLDKTQDEAVEAVWQAVQSLDAETIRTSCTPWLDKKKEEDPIEKVRIVFFYHGEPVTNRQSVKDFWERKYTTQGTSWEKDKLPREGICSVTGESKVLVGNTMPVKIKGVPAIQGSGAALMSFNYKSAGSRKWQDTEHAPMGFDVAVRSHQMLNRLLQEPRHSYRQGGSSFVYWGEDGTGLSPLIFDDPEELWEDNSAEVAQMIFVSLDNPVGFKADACKSERFYLAILTGCDGRVAISRWDELTPQRIADNVTRYIQNQKAIRDYKAIPIWQLAGACFRDGSKDQIDIVVRSLVGNALWGDPIPPSVAKQAMERIHLDLFSDKKDLKNYYGRYFARFQILALYLDIMNDKPQNDKRRLKIAQHLGAIAYLMHNAEMNARNLDDAGKTGVAGSLRSLSNTPKQVFSRLYQNAILYHLPTSCNDGEPKKQESRRRQLKRTGKLLRDEFSALVELGLSPITDLPNTFSLDESAWFYLGWGMREATFWAGIDSNKSANKDNDAETEKEGQD